MNYDRTTSTEYTARMCRAGAGVGLVPRDHAVGGRAGAALDRRPGEGAPRGADALRARRRRAAPLRGRVRARAGAQRLRRLHAARAAAPRAARRRGARARLARAAAPPALARGARAHAAIRHAGILVCFQLYMSRTYTIYIGKFMFVKQSTLPAELNGGLKKLLEVVCAFV